MLKNIININMKNLVIAAGLLIAGTAFSQNAAPGVKLSPEKMEARKQKMAENWELYKRELNLTDAQMQQIKAAEMKRRESLKDDREKMLEAKRALQSARKEERQDFHAHLKEILKPEQYAKFVEMKKAQAKAERPKPVQTLERRKQPHHPKAN